jgi:hypothetical protein
MIMMMSRQGIDIDEIGLGGIAAQPESERNLRTEKCGGRATQDCVITP